MITDSGMVPPLAALSDLLPLPCRFLGPTATPVQLIRATAANHVASWVTDACAKGDEIRREGGVTWIFTAHDGGLTVAFPRMTGREADTMLDTLVTTWRRRKPQRIACWSLEPTCPRDLGARLAARGFEWGWKPHWMALDLVRMRGDFPVPDGLRIAVDDMPDWDVDDLPYYSRAQTPLPLPVSPQRRWHFGAWLEGKVVGQSTLLVTTGRLGVAGIYNVGVVPSARGQGIGRAVSLAACQFARALGCRWITLNAATHIYKRLGFVSLGWGQTWWMHASTLAAPPPTPAQIAFAEAIGRGNIKALNALNTLPEDLDAFLPGGHTPMALAVQAEKPASAEWLAASGATLDILSAWDLGWQDRVPHLLAETPDLANRRSGKLRTTPLHEAVERGDMTLLRLLLAVDPDLTIQDTQFHATALGWAHHSGQTEMIALLERYRAARVGSEGS